MFQNCGIAVGFFPLQLQKGSKDSKKTKRLSKEEFKKQLIDSIINNEIFETEELHEKADKAEKPEDAVALIKQYEDIIRTKKKNIISIPYHQGKVFKRFKDKEKFIKLVNEFKVHKGTIIFKINIFTLIEKLPRLMKSSVTLGFLKTYQKYIKQICQENSNEFEQIKVV